ncbi:MAG: trypsin-like peptidase domain-containing protein, partial [Kiritimatiellae bacterium]|nr:trypsin-like peptidase domain-containing protein [Kiritimatiellia bacterium]
SRRVDLKEALKEAGRIGKSRLDWGWIFARVFIGLMGLLILGSLVYGLSQVDGCKTPKIGPGIGQGGGGGAGGTGPGEVGGDNGGDRSGGTDQGGTGGDGGGVGGGTGQGGLGGEKVGDNAGGSPPKPQDGEAPEDGPCGEKAGDDAGGEQPKPQDGAAPNDNQDVENPDGNADSKVPDVVIPRFSIRLESDGDNGNGTFSPVFSLISQKEMPTKANVLWELDGEKVTNEAARQTSFRPQFPDRSRHVIVADIEIPNADTQRTPQFVWSPDAPDTGKSGEDVRRFIEQIGEREDKVGTYFLFDVGSDPQDGKVSVLSWSVRKVEPKTSQRDIPPVYEGGNTNVLQVHSGDVAGNAQIEISARVVIDGKGERDIKAKRTFGVSSGDTADSLTPKESQQMMKAGERIKPSVYLVVTSTGSGTAFAVGKKYLVTNRHVAEGAKKSWFRSGKLSLYAAGSNDAISGVVKATDNVSDLALIQIDGKTDMTALALAEKVYPRQIAACVGYSVPALNAEKKSSGGYEPEVATGVLNGYNPWAKTAYSDLKAFHGNSGSPVVNEQGKVVGVVFAGTWKGTADKEIKEDLHRSCLVTLEMLKSFLNKNGVK